MCLSASFGLLNRILHSGWEHAWGFSDSWRLRRALLECSTWPAVSCQGRVGKETTYESSSIVLKERGDFGQQLQPNDVPLVGTVPGVAFVISCPQNEVALQEASGFGFVSILEVVAVGLDMISAIDTS